MSLPRHLSAVYERIHRHIQIEILRHQLRKLPLGRQAPPVWEYLDDDVLREDVVDDDDIFY